MRPRPRSRPFSSKYDAVQAGKAQFTPQEKQGYDLFRGKAAATSVIATAGPARTRCSPISPRAISAPRQSVDFPTTPKTSPTQCGYVANTQRCVIRRSAASAAFSATAIRSASPRRSIRVGCTLACKHGSNSRCRRCAMSTSGPSPDFVKAYGHNGYFKSLKEIVHFYNTRDMLPRCVNRMILARASVAGPLRRRQRI